jgi:spermidine synthase
MNEFGEKWRGWRQAAEVREVLYDGRSEFQSIQVLDTVPFGRLLVLEGATQTSTVGDWTYHEALVHVPMMAHPAPRRVLIIGGGDGGALRHVLMHPVEKATMVEIDGEVVRVSREFTPSICGDAFEDPRAELIIGDGVKYLRETTERFDVILVDSTDPVGPAADLFGERFYRDVVRVLGPGGIVVTQGGSPLVMLDELQTSVALFRRVFPVVRTYVSCVPIYPGVLWSFTAASATRDPADAAPDAIRARLRDMGHPTGWYTAATHQAAFALPNWLANALDMRHRDDPSALSVPVSDGKAG